MRHKNDDVLSNHKSTLVSTRTNSKDEGTPLTKLETSFPPMTTTRPDGAPFGRQKRASQRSNKMQQGAETGVGGTFFKRT